MAPWNSHLEQRRNPIMNPYYPHLFEPLTIKGVTFRNRLFVAPT